MEEHHHLADNLLVGPGGDNPLGPLRPNAVHFPEAIGLGLDHIEDAVREGALPRIDWADPQRRRRVEDDLCHNHS
jgi:hypothetical protein